LTAQEIKVSGVWRYKSALPGTSILVKGTTKGSSTDADGKYNICRYRRCFTIFFYRFESKSVKVTGLCKCISSWSGETQDVVILGSRGAPRTVTESAVPIDVISMKEISSQRHK
jgi:iron complex outermembrane receptor protein